MGNVLACLSTLFLGIFEAEKENFSGDSVVNIYFLGLGKYIAQYLSSSCHGFFKKALAHSSPNRWMLVISNEK